MESDLLPENPDELLAVAEDIATFLIENHEEIGISRRTVAVLVASIAAAAHARSAYLAILEDSSESPVALRHLAAARKANDGAERQLRRRLTSMLGSSAVVFNEYA